MSGTCCFIAFQGANYDAVLHLLKCHLSPNNSSALPLIATCQIGNWKSKKPCAVSKLQSVNAGKP